MNLHDERFSHGRNDRFGVNSGHASLGFRVGLSWCPIRLRPGLRPGTFRQTAANIGELDDDARFVHRSRDFGDFRTRFVRVTHSIGDNFGDDASAKPHGDDKHRDDDARGEFVER